MNGCEAKIRNSRGSFSKHPGIIIVIFAGYFFSNEPGRESSV
jgi:hypothetical protein